MKAKAFLIASLFAMSLSLTACGGNSEETPATEMDTTAATEMAPSTTVGDTAAPVTAAPVDTAAASTTVTTDTAAVSDTTTK